MFLYAGVYCIINNLLTSNVHGLYGKISNLGIVVLKCWNRELTLKCKFKCYVKPIKDPLGVSPSKGNQGTTRGIRSTVTLPTELRGGTEKVGDDFRW